MKGIVFRLMADFIEESFGLETWEDILDIVDPASQGAYTVAGTYPFSELMSIVEATCKMKNLDMNETVESFGTFMFPSLASKYPVFLKNVSTLKDFLKSINDVIHIEVRKLYPDAGLPTIEYEDPDDKQLIMLYRSPRKLCWLATGLIKGAAKHFDTTVKISQSRCLHSGDDHCRIEIEFSD